MTDHTDKARQQIADEQAAKTAREREERGIPPEMEDRESKGSPHDDRLRSEVSHGKPDEPGRNPTGGGS